MNIRQRRRRVDALALFLLFTFTLCALVIVGANVWARLSPANSVLDNPDTELGWVERNALGAYLLLYADDLTKPAGEAVTPQTFTVAQGEVAEQIAKRLAEQGLVSDARLLSFYLRYHGLDKTIEAGDFILRPSMTIPEVARTLGDASAREVPVRIIEGWRREQIGQSLAANPNLQFNVEEWLALTGPGAEKVGDYAVYAELPSGTSLEGFLYPDTYLFKPQTSTRDLLKKLLAEFDQQITPDFRFAIGQRQLTVYQAVIIASLIEREAVLDEERPVIASVIFNRLNIGQPLQIDATVQYAIAQPENWWPGVAGLDFRAIASPYNTYIITGLPPAPISNVRAASLQAVAKPTATDYYYYRAMCDGSGRHNFARTYDEHLANACP